MILTAAALAACSPDVPSAPLVSNAQDLEAAAIERGLVRDPQATEIAGLYARDTDRVCIVPDGAGQRIGVVVDYGQGVACNARGAVVPSGERMRVTFSESCTFEARYDGERIAFPGRLPDGCQALCRGRASLAGLEVARLSESLAEARAMRDARGRLPCRG